MRIPLPPIHWAHRLALPLRLMPTRLNNEVASRLLGQVFASQLQAGELDFLDRQTIAIDLRDLGMTFHLSLHGQRIVAGAPGRFDLWVQGESLDFLALLAGREDPDTLFFRRRLRMQGNTALGVHLKNFLASLEPESLPAAQWVLRQLGRILDQARPATIQPEHSL